MVSCRLPFESPKSWRDKWINGQGRCIQGNHTSDTHKGDLAYAFDFKLRPGTKVLAARAGVVVALCDHFGEGGIRESLRPRANFVALRHHDGTYTRYVHLMRGGVLVKLGQEVAAGHPIGLSGNTGYTSGPHLHFDVVDVLPQETSELWIVHPAVFPLPSVAAIFSGPLNRQAQDFATAPLLYLSPETLSRFSSTSGGEGAQLFSKPAPAASLLPVPVSDRGRPEVVVLIDRGGAGGEQTFVEAVATAARAASAAVSHSSQAYAPQASSGGGAANGFPGPAAYGSVVGNGGRRGSGGSHRGSPALHPCRCVGVIVANDRPGDELFPMATHLSAGQKGMRAPFPVVMVSQESGQLLKSALLSSSPTVEAAAATNAPGAAAAAAAAAQRFEGARWGGAVQGQFSWSSTTVGGNGVQLPPARVRSVLGGRNGGGGGGGGGGVVFVSLGAAEHCPTPTMPASRAGTFCCDSSSSSSGSSDTSSPATSTSSSAAPFDEEDGEHAVGRALFSAAATATSYGRYGGAGNGLPLHGGIASQPQQHQQQFPPHFPCHLRQGLAGVEAVGPRERPHLWGANGVAPWIAGSDGHHRVREWSAPEEEEEEDDEEDEEDGEWKRERMLYRAKTLPVSFETSIW